MRASLFWFVVSIGVGGCHSGSSNHNSDLGDVDLAGDTDGGNVVTTDLVPVTVSGKVLAWENDMPIAGSATVSTAGITPTPTVSLSGPDFTLGNVLPNSVFTILAGSPPDYRTTYNVAPVVGFDNVADVKAWVVAETTLATLATGFSLTPNGTKGIVLVQLVNDAGAGVANVPASAIQLNGAAPPTAPGFLDATKMPMAGATATTASGWIVFFDVAPGLVSVTPAMGANYTFDSPAGTTSAGLVTVLHVHAATGMAPTVPTNVSFTNQVIPIFTKRGCVACHSGNGPGKDLGGLTLNGAPMKIHGELTTEISPNFATTRVNLVEPLKSLMLTMPSAETPPDPHPTIVFPNNQDPDYLTFYGWIKEGAKLN
jgi:hypothetical protein